MFESHLWKKLTSALLCAVFNARKDVNDTERALNAFRAGGGGGRGSTPPPVAPGTPRDTGPSKDDDGATKAGAVHVLFLRASGAALSVVKLSQSTVAG